MKFGRGQARSWLKTTKKLFANSITHSLLREQADGDPIMDHTPSTCQGLLAPGWRNTERPCRKKLYSLQACKHIELETANRT